jgi:hypothetical protein
MEDAPATPLPPASRRVRLRRGGLFLTLLALLGMLVAACSSPGNSSDPSQSATSGSSGSGPQAGSSSGAQSGQVAFAQCVRAHGVTDFPDPQNGHFLISGADQNNPNFQPAVSACQHLLGPGGISQGGASHNSALLTFAHCMQTHGVPQFPDPSANGAIGLPTGVNPNSPQFQNAMQKCQSDLPGGAQTVTP